MDADATPSAVTHGMALTLRQLLRFGVVGLALNGVLFLAYLALVEGGLLPKPAMTIMYAIGLVIGFQLHRRVTFDSRETPRREWGAYLAICLGGYVFNLGALALCVDVLHWPHAWVQGAAVVVIAGLTFVRNKFWVFAPAERPA